jgi:glycosyltransferase involved in cell wall biosynthesis
MPNVQFLAVKGAYGEQDIRYPKPHNVVYLENQKDIYNVFNKVGILLMPSHIETWGRTAVEAMASGIPVIHSEAGGLVECVGGAGVLCQRDDIDAWCQAIRRILGDRAYRETLRQNGFRRVSDIEKEQIRGRRELVYKIENS